MPRLRDWISWQKLALLLILTIFLGGLWKWRQQAAQKSRIQTAQQWIEQNNVRQLVKSGDIICRAGSGIWSDLATELSPREKRFSHAGIILVANDSTVSVVHAEANDYTGIGAIKEEPLAHFLSGGNDFAIFRLRQQHPQIFDTETFTTNIRKYLGIPFDYKFDLLTEDRMYCTEFIYHAMRNLNPPIHLSTITSEKGKVFVPVDSCHDPLLFNSVIEHIISQQQ